MPDLRTGDLFLAEDLAALEQVVGDFESDPHCGDPLVRLCERIKARADLVLRFAESDDTLTALAFLT